MELEIWHFILLFIIAFFSGFVDAIAGGGGLIAIPALIAVGIPEHVALATNKLQASFGSFTAALNFTRKGFVDFKAIWAGCVWTFLGAVLGTTATLLTSPEALKIIIPVVLIAIFFYTIFSPKLGEFELTAKIKPAIYYCIFGLILGFYDGFLGPGTGSFWMISLVLLLGLGLKTAVAQTKVLNFISNIVSLAVFIAGGQILWILGFVMGVGQVAGAYLGSHLAIKKEVRFIRTIFLCVVAATILKLVYDLFFG